MTESERVLVIGGTGMLGHKVWQVLRDRYDTWVTARDVQHHRMTGLFPADRTITDVRVEDLSAVVRAVTIARPTVVINCVGIVKQVNAASNQLRSIEVNALFPHRMAAVTGAIGARLIHLSTDCVFSGTRGRYTERDLPDPQDWYGRTKLLGEVCEPGCLTLRTSFIGRELVATTGLAEWFLSQRGRRVDGYTRARFSGLTTRALARLLADVIAQYPSLHGVYHVASTGISKCDLLHKLNQAYDAGVQIEPSTTVQVDRTLDGSLFARTTGMTSPDWDEMIADMAADPTPYDEWRRAGV